MKRLLPTFAFLCAAVALNAQVTPLYVNKATGVIVGPIDAATFKAINSFSSGSGLPDQTDQSGFVLTTNGTTASWSNAFASTTLANSFSGIQTWLGADIISYTAMPALDVNLAKKGNYKALTGNVTVTYSSASPTDGTTTWICFTADGTDRVVTIPSTWSVTRKSNITSVTVSANSALYLRLQYRNSRFEMFGDPPATSGTGSSLALIDGTLVVSSGKTATINNSVTIVGTDGTTQTMPPASAALGYINVPVNSQSTAYTTVLADQGKFILHPTADNNSRTFTIDSNANVAYPVGTTITIVNQINTVTIAITSDTLTWYQGAGVGSTGSRTLSAGGVATLLKIASTSWIITGPGVN